MKKTFKILSIFGTRPEAIKMAPVVMKLAAMAEASGGRIVSRTLVTAQHRQMLDDVLKIFGIKADCDLDLMSENQSLHDLTAKVITRVSEFLALEKPDLVLVHGDTTTAMASSLAAFYQKIKVAHVEAGLRTSNIYAPFPEEINRRVCDVISSVHFAPTENARKNLIREGVPPANIAVTGNTVVDALYYIIKNKAVPVSSPRIKKALGENRKIVLVTAHRRENFGEPFERMCDAFFKIVSENEDAVIVYPVHLNPNVKNLVERKFNEFKGPAKDRIILEAPMQYLEFVTLMNAAYIILTDSGGIQEEGATLSKPVLVMREDTERPEIIEAGCGILVGADTDKISREVKRLISSRAQYDKMACGSKCFGDGDAADKIAALICEPMI
ncbi:MAG TPA: UDP-N-acetylglucosamine 2-epimerase (non-hydrolyzing) [Candidatus Wallbacteria bacterium]|nr:UDP-N-acetylglucosamine 2-epimerase (non-hydrolyzing) [Candidatus Wallbacteria bacterium]